MRGQQSTVLLPAGQQPQLHHQQQRQPLKETPLKEECFARAVFANEADYPGELSFEKDDVLRVISQKPEIEGCSDGWWLCVDKNGNRGIAPGNRLKVMQRGFDDGFFRVAKPFMDDFFAFNGSPFDDPFFRNGRQGNNFSSSVRDRLFDAPQMRRMNSCDDALKNVGVIRNIPIRVEKGPNERLCHSQVNIPEHIPTARRHSDFPSEFRRTPFESNNGRISPASSRRHSESQVEERPQRVVSSDEEERRSVRSERSPQRTLVIPSAGGRTIEIPLGEPMLRPPYDRERSKSPKPESQLEKLTQRLRNIAARPFRAPSNPNSGGVTKETPVLHNGFKEDRSPSPSSSGIGADLTDSSHSGEENKRTSDLSSLSGSDQNGPIFPLNDEDPRMSRQQPYLGRLVQTPTSVIQAVFDGLDRQQPQSRLNVDEDMRRNESLPWNHVPTTLVGGGKGVGDVLEEEIHARKRVVCNKMSECLRSIETAVNQIQKVTAPQHWRVAHVLQPNLSSLRDAAATASESLESFVDSTGRISIDRTNPKSVELNRLLQPLIDSRRLLVNLKKALDQTGWTVATLSRDREQARVMDPLEQFVSVVGQVPADCRLLLQWVHVLVPSSTVIFLSPIARPHNPVVRPVTIERPTFLAPSQDEKRLSSSSTSSAAASVDTPPSSILITKPNLDKPRGRVTFADEAGDRTSTSSSGDNSSVEYSTIQKPPRLAADHLNVPESRILEEDDLESIVSDRDSLFQDYAYLDDVVPGRSNGTAAPPKQQRINDEDRQLVRFYAPQLEQHTEALSLAIEEFLGTVENHLPPREFVQKGKLIILAAHKLIYIGDSVSQCVRDRTVSRAMRDSADQLCEQLKDCVRATKTAADEFPEIKSMQTMVDAIIAVSKSAHRLKLMIKECC